MNSNASLLFQLHVSILRAPCFHKTSISLPFPSSSSSSFLLLLLLLLGRAGRGTSGICGVRWLPGWGLLLAVHPHPPCRERVQTESNLLLPICRPDLCRETKLPLIHPLPPPPPPKTDLPRPSPSAAALRLVLPRTTRQSPHLKHQQCHTAPSIECSNPLLLPPAGSCWLPWRSTSSTPRWSARTSPGRGGMFEGQLAQMGDCEGVKRVGG